MTVTNYPACLQFTLHYEGGNSDDPADPGGRTRKGVTQATYNAFRDRHGLARQDVFTMPDSEMQEIYRTEYWDIVHGDALRAGEDLCVFDFAVNSGPVRAKSFWGISGGSRAAVEDVIQNLCESRLTFLKGLRTWSRFGSGWKARVEACEATAHKMAEVPVPAVPAPAPHVPAPQVPEPVPLPPAVPVGPPPISATSAGRIAAQIDTLTAMRAARIAELVVNDPEIAAYDAGLAAFTKLGGVSSLPSTPPSPTAAIPAPSAVAKPAAAITQGNLIMNPQVQATLRSVLLALGGAAVSKGIIDESTLTSLVGGAVSALSYGWSLWGHSTTNIIAAAASLPEVQKVVTTPAIADSPKFAANNRVVAH